MFAMVLLCLFPLVRLTQEQTAISIDEAKEGLPSFPPHGETGKDGDAIRCHDWGRGCGGGGVKSSPNKKKGTKTPCFVAASICPWFDFCSMQRRLLIGSAANLFAVTQRLAPRMMRDRRGFNVTRANCRPAIRRANKGCIYTQEPQEQSRPIMIPGPWKCRTKGETGLPFSLRLVCAALPLTARL